MEERVSAQDKLKRALRIGQAVRLVWESAAGWTMANVVLQVIQGVVPLAPLYIMKLVVDAVSQAPSVSDKSLVLHRAVLLVVVAALAAIIDGACRSLSRVVSECQTQTVTDHIQKVIYSKSIEMDLEYYENPKYYDTLHQAQSESSYRPQSIVNGLTQLVQSTISLAAVLVLLISLNWIIAAVLFAAALPEVFSRLKYSRDMYRWNKDRTQSQRQGYYLGWLLSGDYAAKEIRLFDLGRTLLERFVELRATLRKGRLRIAKSRSLTDIMSQCGATAAVFGSFVYLVHKAVYGAVSAGDLVMFFGVFQRGLSSLQQVMGTLTNLYEDNLFLTYLQDFLALKPGLIAPARPREVPNPPAEGFAFEHVTFSYPTGEKPVLDDIVIRIKPGQTVALVGENGSGKTTLIKLLTRLYDPAAGSVTLDGVDLREFDPVELRRHMAVVLQDYMRYDATALENVWYGNVQRPPDLEHVRSAARQAGIDDVIMALEKGYDTYLGRIFEDAHQLSIGEWQKMALARAFAREAHLIVLDEPTSSMDAGAECEFFTRFRELAEGRTTVIISHRFSTVRVADYIYVLDKGRVVESGTHQELVELGGKYAQLYEMQAGHYR